jgi:arginyl-tRNA synthetase
LQKGVFYKKQDNSVWINLEDVKLDEKLVLRGDGTSVYITQDIGTAELKYKDFGIDKSVYVVGNEQDYHFKVLIEILKKMGRPYANGMFHLSYGMVDLPSGKMKSREGTVVDADDLMQEMADTARQITNELGKTEGMTEAECNELYETIGLGALKYFLLKVDPKKRMLFNPAESIDFKGHTGPFIQYTFARMNAIMRKAESMNIDVKSLAINSDLGLEVSEKDILILLEKYPDTISEAAESYSPSLIANFVYDLAKAYNRFYTEVSIFNEENKDKFHYRLAITFVVAKTIKASMKLLGINVPPRM